MALFRPVSWRSRPAGGATLTVCCTVYFFLDTSLRLRKLLTSKLLVRNLAVEAECEASSVSWVEQVIRS
jgi:hypothetical protein